VVSGSGMDGPQAGDAGGRTGSRYTAYEITLDADNVLSSGGNREYTLASPSPRANEYVSAFRSFP
jgi:hypothetical protein